MDLYHRSFVASSLIVPMVLRRSAVRGRRPPFYSSLLLVVWNPNANMTILMRLSLTFVDGKRVEGDRSSCRQNVTIAIG